MSLYYETLYAWKCKGTHHKLAMEALPLLSCEFADDWSNLFLRHIESYLTGSKDPDNKFKDFRNHVLHVTDNNWGGAIKATEDWYAKARQAFTDGHWKEGVYASGVMSHYLTDIFCPLHTGQSEKENIMHRACEWSASCSYDDLIDHLLEDLGGFPRLTIPGGNDWLRQLILTEANQANAFYTELVEGYNFDKGVKKPTEGFDEKLTREMALTLGRAAVALAAVLDRCLKESGQKPPAVSLSLHAALAQLTIPVFWVTQKMASAADRAEVMRIYNELQQTGTVEKNLPEENRVIRDLVYQEHHPEEAAKPAPQAAAVQPAQTKPKIVVSSKASTNSSSSSSSSKAVEDPFAEEASSFGARPVSAQGEYLNDDALHEDYEDDDTPQIKYDTDVSAAGKNSKEAYCYLQFDSPIVDAPSIGPKTASRFRKINMDRVHDLLTTDAQTIAYNLNTRWITADLVIAWQQQAELMCSVPGLRGHDAQLLQGIGVENYLDLANSTPEDLLPLVQEFAQTTEGQRIIRSGKLPDMAEVSFWIENARRARQNQAA